MFESTNVILLNNTHIQNRRVFPKPGAYGLLYVYADWCRFCQESKYDVIKAANALLKEGYPVFALNETFKTALNQLDIVSFPSLFIVFPDGSLQKYEGPRDANTLVKQVKYNAGTLLQTADADFCIIM